MKKEKHLPLPARNSPMPPSNPSLQIPSADSLSPDMSQADLDRLERFLSIKSALRAEEAHQAEIDEAKRARIAGIENTRQAMAQIDLKQQLCAHKKENGRTNLAGQRDHDGIVHLICQMCQKHFTGNQVPFDLRPMMETVGGPNN